MRLISKIKDRKRIFTIRNKRNARIDEKRWYVGVSSENTFALDFDKATLEQVVWIGQGIQMMFPFKPIIHIFQTRKAYWLVIPYVELETSRKLWAWALANYISDICEAFVLCCLKYNKITLRVSMKNGNIPKRIGIIGKYGDYIPIEKMMVMAK